jgi:replication factor C subunit 2/4
MIHQKPQLWVDTYKPNVLEDLIIDENLYKQIKMIKYNCYCCIMTGMSGVGKTCAAKCIGMEIVDNHTENYLEINSTNDKSIKNINDIVNMLYKKLTVNKKKVLILNEFDNITQKYQNDISILIKTYNDKITFIFTCNDTSKIIDNIQSMSKIINFKKLSDNQITEQLVKICDDKNISYTNNGISTISYLSEGDMRKAINEMQKIYYSYNKITKKHVMKICKIPDPHELMIIVTLCQQKKLESAINELKNKITDGFYYIDIINGFFNLIITLDKITENERIKLIEEISKKKILISLGVNSELQMYALICEFIKIFN